MTTEKFSTLASVVEQLPSHLFCGHEQVFIKRDDLIHPIVSGNKYRKLKLHLQKVMQENKNRLVTFGGAFSNHMVATASAAASHGLKSTAFIRGEELEVNFNHYLKTASLFGMEFIPTERLAYATKKNSLFDLHFGKDSGAYFIGEGGESEEAEWSASEIVDELPLDTDIIVLASATGTTAAGLLRGICASKRSIKVYPITILKNAQAQQLKLDNLSIPYNYEIISEFDFGGYAKTNDALFVFIKEFISATGIVIDPVYTGKALFALKSCIESGRFESTKKIVFLHTGGTLGIFSDRYLKNIGSEILVCR